MPDMEKEKLRTLQAINKNLVGLTEQVRKLQRPVVTQMAAQAEKEDVTPLIHFMRLGPDFLPKCHPRADHLLNWRSMVMTNDSKLVTCRECTE